MNYTIAQSIEDDIDVEGTLMQASRSTLGHGGWRPGSGRKPKGARARLSHKTRAAVDDKYPVHVTLKLKRRLPKPRNKKTYKVLIGVLWAASDRFGMRICEFSIQQNHLHLLIEADDRASLTKGMRGLTIRVAKALNGLWGRKGKFFADRFHDRVLRSTTDVWKVLNYILNNARKHGEKLPFFVDLFSSGPWFDGWHSGNDGLLPKLKLPPRPTAQALSPVLAQGWWRMHGRISFLATPGRML